MHAVNVIAFVYTFVAVLLPLGVGTRHRPLLTIGGLVLVVAAVGWLGTSLSGLMAWRAQQARSQAAMISAPAAAGAPTTRPVLDDPALTEEDLPPDEEPPE